MALPAIAAGTATLLVWAAVDLWGSHRTELRRFDPDEVARLDTAMWRSYYAKERLRLFGELAELLRTQYRMPLLRSNLVAFHAARAAFVFKEGQNRTDYERALPDLVRFFGAIREASDTPFDVERVARLELEWWIVHRERASLPAGSLDHALAETAAALYEAPVERFAEHARLRAEAMEIRDSGAESGGVSEEDWARIDELLHRSWRSLHNAVNRP